MQAGTLETGVAGAAIGNFVGTTLGKYLVGDNIFAQVAVGSVLGTVLGAVGAGQFGALFGSGDGGTKAVESIANHLSADFGAQFANNVKTAGVSALSSFLTAELAESCWLNERGYRTRVGARWGIGPLHQILTRATYKGERRFNRKVWKTKEAKPDADQIVVPVPPIIDAAAFDVVQALLKAKNPKVVPPRVVTGPILLTGIATCASCGGGMTLRTGKSGRYRYYTCATCAQRGKAACKGRSFPWTSLTGW